MLIAVVNFACSISYVDTIGKKSEYRIRGVVMLLFYIL